MSTQKRQAALGEAVEAYLFDLKAAGRSERTIENYTYPLKTLALFIEARGIKGWAGVAPGDLREHLMMLTSDGLKPSSVSTKATVISCFFNWLDTQEIVRSNPMLRLRRPRMPQRIVRVFTTDELLALFTATESSPNPRRNKAMLALLLDCGLRASELLAIGPSDYDQATLTLTVKGKGRKTRFLKVGQCARGAFEEYLQNPNGNLWPFERHGLAGVIRTLGRKAGVKANPHKFRHTFAMRFLDAGGRIDELQYLMGHSKIVTTMIYAAAGQEQRALKSHAEHSPLDALL